MQSVPVSESLRLAAVRILGHQEHETCLSGWARIKLRCKLERGSPILIAGLPKHGKTYVANTIGEMLKLKWCNTSDLIKEKFDESAMCSSENLNKEDIRHHLIRIGDDICKDDPGAIVRTMFARGNKVIAGLRKPEELKSLIGLDPFVIWVTRPNCETVKDNTLITPEYCDFVLVNDDNLTSRLQSLLFS